MAYESPLTIAEVVKDISANKYVLPSIKENLYGVPHKLRDFLTV